ncbi:MAG: L,D-transpeptidase family protein [Pseudonocardiaceae bacterium]|nr:L,D-transpeptidase family protein [Pseudonocardiaceae bacterium]
MRGARVLIGALTAVAAAAGAALAAATPAMAQESAPCSAAASACVDLSADRAWLMDDGTVTYGPVPITSGKPGYETPSGDFQVTWKDKDHRSREYDNAPMPYSVFFTDTGIAFHEGSLQEESHGCIHLSHEAAVTFYDQLSPGEGVEVVG